MFVCLLDWIFGIREKEDRALQNAAIKSGVPCKEGQRAREAQEQSDRAMLDKFYKDVDKHMKDNGQEGGW